MTDSQTAPALRWSLIRVPNGNAGTNGAIAGVASRQLSTFMDGRNRGQD